jgi:hypothetical protein
MRFREVVLVIVLVLAGLVVYQVQTGRWNVNPADWNWGWDEGFGGFGREFASEETRTIEGPLPPVLEVVNGHGWVEVRGADQDTVQLTFKKVVWRRTEEEARDVAGRIKYTADAAADKLTLATNRDEFRKKNFETGFVLTVPRTMSVRVTNGYGVVRVERVKEAVVRNRHGELFASDIEGPCTLETSYEDLEVQGVRGECRLKNGHADVRATSIAGDLNIETSYGRVRVEDAGGKVDAFCSNVDVDLRRVQGAVFVETSYENVFLSDVGPAKVTGHNMAVTAENVRGDLDVATSYEPVQAKAVQGRFLVDAHNSPVTAIGVGGDLIRVGTSYENVTLSGFSAEAEVVCRNGNVRVEPLDLKHGLDVRSEYGTIDLIWPAGQRARLEARSKGGSVSWGLGERPDVDETNGVSLVKAFSSEAGAPLIYLSTTYENVRITEGGRKL